MLLANIVVKPFWFLGVEVGVQNSVGAEMYGLYFAVFNLSYIFNILLDLGITNFNTRNIAQNPLLITKHLPQMLGIKVLLLGLYMTVTFSVGMIMGYGSTQFKLLAWLCLNQFLSSLVLYLRSNFEGLLLFKWDSLFSVLDRVLMIAICGMMLWGPQLSQGSNHFTIFHFVYAQTAAYLATAAIALIVLFRKTGFRGLKFSKPFTIAIIKRSLPFALLVLLMASYNRLDPILLQSLLPDDVGNLNAGIYAGAFRLLDALSMIAYLVSVTLLPIFSKMTKEHCSCNKELNDTVETIFSMVMVFSVTAACTLSGLDKQLMTLFYDENIEEYAAVFRVLIFCIIPISGTYVFGTLLTAAGQLKQLNILAATALLLGVVTNLLLIPRWAAVGSSWAALATQTFMAVAQILFSVVLFRMKIKWSYILKLTLFTLIIVGSVSITSHMVWWAAIAIAAAAAIVIAIILKLIKIKEIINTLTNSDK